MERFSVRNGFQQLTIDGDWRDSTRTRIWHAFAKEYVFGKAPRQFNIVEDVLSYFGKPYSYTQIFTDHGENTEKLQRFICSEARWYDVADFIEFTLKNTEEKADLEAQYKTILEDEKTGYQLIAGLVTPITNEAEIATIEEALKKTPQHISESIKKSLKLFSDFKHRDYNNAVKEIITALEALCCTIVEGEENTLGHAVDRLSKHGVVINEHLVNAIKELYKYTNKEEGIRHGGTEYKDVTPEDAKFMIVTCSAIINMLVEKWGKIK